MKATLAVRNLRVKYWARDCRQVRQIHALNGVNLQLFPGTAVGILGESACGKSTLAKTVVRILPSNSAVTDGALEFEGEDLLALNEKELETIRGARIALIPQDPGSALNPYLRVGKQIAEVLRVHTRQGWRRCCDDAKELLRLVGLEDSNRRIFDAYPHQLSGGQQQRVVIAQAMSCRPSLVIADEPTSSLDHATEVDILKLLRDLVSQRPACLLLIAHDPASLHGLVDHVAVMYAGRIVEEGPAQSVLNRPYHPYTKALISCVPPDPSYGKFSDGDRFITIPGRSPDGTSIPSSCVFAPRCGSRLDTCQEQTPFPIEVGNSHLVECFLYDRQKPICWPEGTPPPGCA